MGGRGGGGLGVLYEGHFSSIHICLNLRKYVSFVNQGEEMFQEIKDCCFKVVQGKESNCE